MEWGQVIGAALGSAGLTQVVNSVIVWWRANKEELRKDDAQDFEQDRERFKQMLDRIEALEIKDAECQEKYSALQRAYGHLEGRLDEQSKHLERVTKSNVQQIHESIKTTSELAIKGVEAAAAIAEGSGTRLHITSSAEEAAKHLGIKAVLEKTEPDISVHE